MSLERIEYRMRDGREVAIEFGERDGGLVVTETFDGGTENAAGVQRAG